VTPKQQHRAEDSCRPNHQVPPAASSRRTAAAQAQRSCSASHRRARRKAARVRRDPKWFFFLKSFFFPNRFFFFYHHRGGFWWPGIFWGPYPDHRGWLLLRPNPKIKEGHEEDQGACTGHRCSAPSTSPSISSVGRCSGFRLCCRFGSRSRSGGVVAPLISM